LLRLDPNFHEPGRTFFRDFSPGDDFYEALIDAHRDLDESSQVPLVNARLILLLANHIGDLQVLREAMQLARADVAPNT